MEVLPIRACSLLECENEREGNGAGAFAKNKGVVVYSNWGRRRNFAASVECFPKSFHRCSCLSVQGLKPTFLFKEGPGFGQKEETKINFCAK